MEFDLLVLAKVPKDLILTWTVKPSYYHFCLGYLHLARVTLGVCRCPRGSAPASGLAWRLLCRPRVLLRPSLYAPRGGPTRSAKKSDTPC
jgi:hypothetical protein